MPDSVERREPCGWAVRAGVGGERWAFERAVGEARGGECRHALEAWHPRAAEAPPSSLDGLDVEVRRATALVGACDERPSSRGNKARAGPAFEGLSLAVLSRVAAFALDVVSTRARRALQLARDSRWRCDGASPEARAQLALGTGAAGGQQTGEGQGEGVLQGRRSAAPGWGRIGPVLSALRPFRSRAAGDREGAAVQVLAGSRQFHRTAIRRSATTVTTPAVAATGSSTPRCRSVRYRTQPTRAQME